MVLPQEFFNRPTLTVARELIGKFLVRKIGGRKVAVMITETESYDGFKDKASHASRGQTLRNAPMFGRPGVWYVYFTYGMHWMLNIVTREKGYPAAVLIRGAGQYNGPAKLTKALQVDKKLNGKRAIKKNGLWFEDRGVRISSHNITHTKRIGIASAGPVWSRKKYRFVYTK